MDAVRRAARWLVFPLFMVAAMLGMVLALEHEAPIGLVLGLGGIGYAGLTLALERWLPFAPEWNRSHGDLLTDVLHLGVTGGLVESLPALALDEGVGFALWPAAWPVAVQVAMALLLSDFLNYWTHRLMHAGLWRFHAIHHSAPRLYWVNSWRVHPVEGAVYGLTTAVPLLVIGVPPGVLLFTWVFSTVFRMLQHSNVDARLGPLNWVFAMAELHRWHHSKDKVESNRNFGNVLIVWDTIFGTRYLPARPPPVDTGIGEMPDFPAGYFAQIVAPGKKALWRRPNG